MEKLKTSKPTHQQYKQIEAILNNYIYLKARVKNIELDIEEQNIFYSLKAIKLNNLDGKIVLEQEKQQKIKLLKDNKRKLEIKLKRIDNILSTLTKKEYDLIQYRYFEGLTIKEIANIFFKSEQSIQEQRHNIILKKLVPLYASFIN